MTLFSFRRDLLIAGTFTVFLQSCALPFERPGQQTPQMPVATVLEAPATAPKPNAPAVTAAPSVAAAERLQRQAADAAESGDFARAIALLERAQRIAPRDGSIYRDIATAHRAGGRPDLACQFARKGLSVPVEADVAEDLMGELNGC